MPDRARAYVPPRALPPVTDHKTLEIQTVRLAPEIDPRRAPTQPGVARVRWPPKARNVSLRPVTLRAFGSDPADASAYPESVGSRVRRPWLGGTLAAVGVVLVGVVSFIRVSTASDLAGHLQVGAPIAAPWYASDLVVGGQGSGAKPHAAKKRMAVAAKPTEGTKPAASAEPAAGEVAASSTHRARTKPAAAEAAASAPWRARPEPTAAAKQRSGPEMKPGLTESLPQAVPAKKRPRSLF